jgi:hypothetical protein
MKLAFLIKKDNVSMTPVPRFEVPEHALYLKRQSPNKEQAKNKKEMKHGN